MKMNVSTTKWDNRSWQFLEILEHFIVVGYREKDIKSSFILLLLPIV